MSEFLTKTETRVLCELLSGKVRKEIASTLNVSLNAVRFHLVNLYRKLGCSGRLEVIRKYGNERTFQQCKP